MIQARRLFLIAKTLVLVLILFKEGYMNIGSPKVEDLRELVSMAQIILVAKALPSDSLKMQLIFNDSGVTIPPLEWPKSSYKKIEVLMNATGYALPDTFSVYPGNTSNEVKAIKRFNVDKTMLNFVNKYYSSSLREKDLTVKPIILFLKLEYDNQMVPSTRLEFAAEQGYEKESKRSKVLKLIKAKALESKKSK